MAPGLDKIRNIGIMAHIDAGKTTVTERILYFAGRTYKIGEVHQGTAVMDYLAEEQERGITITSAATTLRWGKHTVNLIDTPGHVDFTVEVERSLRVLDGAVAVFSGVEGVEAQSETVWRQADHYRVPRLCFINKMDRIGADFDTVVREIRSRLAAIPIVMQIPMGAGDNFIGQIDVLTRKAYFYDPAEKATTLRVGLIPAEYADDAELARHELIEKAAEFDDELMAKFIDDEPIEVDEVLRALRVGTIHNKCQPVFCGTALRHMGVRPLLDAVVRLLPSPLDVPSVEGYESLSSEKKILRRADPDEPFSALVFKIASDQHGDLSYIRIYSGTLLPGTRVLNSTQNIKENVTRLWEMHAKQRTRRDEARAGDILAVVGLKRALTGDTLCDSRRPVVLERLEFPEPVITMSIEPRTNAEKQRMVDALNTLRREDPTFKYNYIPETGQTTISGMGELHLEVIHHKLTRDMGLDVRVGKPSVAYKETIHGKAEAEGRFIRQTGGRGQFAILKLRLESYTPPAGGEPVVFEDQIKGGVIPKEFVEAVREGVHDAATSGPLAGYPMLNIRATLLDGETHPVDSSALAFQQAAAMAFRAAAEQAHPVFLEPIMRLQVTVPEEYLGAVTGDLNGRRAVIRKMDQRGVFRVLLADVPLAAMFGYSTQLRSLTQGRGTSTMEPRTYAAVPAQVAESILKYY